jgi:hypothetical protein
MATIIRTDGTRVEKYDYKGLEAKQKAVGGYIEPIHTSEYIVLVDEEARLRPNSLLNYEASVLANTTIWGNVLVLTHEEWLSENED